MLLYIFSKDHGGKPAHFDIPPDSDLAARVKSAGIDCYSRELSKLPASVIERFEVSTVPVVLGILNGAKVGHAVNDGNPRSLLTLSEQLRALANPVESALVRNLRELLSHGSRDDLRANLSYLRNNCVREMEADPDLFRLAAEASIVCLDDETVTLEQLHEDLEPSDRLLGEFDPFGAPGPPAAETPGELSYRLRQLARKYISGNCPEPAGRNTGPAKQWLRLCYQLKMELLKLIAVKHFLAKNTEPALEAALEAYRLNVAMLQRDLVTPEEFAGAECKQVLEGLFALLPPDNPALLRTRADLENVIGPRLLNAIPESRRPLGGVAKKRRGFGGRYIWQGLEYRPKRYKPRNPRQYLNEWRCVQDCNPPAFN